MRRRRFVFGMLSISALAPGLPALRAQQPSRMRRVAVLMLYAEKAPEGQARARAFREDPFTNVHRKRIVELATAHKFPIVASLRSFADEGGLLAYGVNLSGLFRQGAGYVDRILKGEKPADMPVQQPTKFEMIVNLKSAKALDLVVPATILARADEVVE